MRCGLVRRFTLCVEVRDRVDNRRPGTVMLTRNVAFQLAKLLGKGRLLRLRELLIAKNQNMVLEKGFADQLLLPFTKRFREVHR